jgi:putative DNA primase/helicase
MGKGGGMNTSTIESIKKAAHTMTASIRKQGYSLEAKHGGAIHYYTAPDGAITFARLRLKHPDTGEKWIRPLRRDTSGDWCELKAPEFDGGAPLYNLHQLCDQARQSERMILVEGELKVDMLALRGILATTSGGAQSVEAADWQPSSGHSVLVWADNDKPGADYAQHAADKLKTLGCEVAFIDVAALSLPPKGDVVGWLKAFHQQHGRKATAADLWALPVIERTPEKVEAVGSDSSHSNKGGNTNAPTWPIPQPLTAKIEAESYPIDALPDTIRAAVEEVGGFVKAPVPLVASSAIAALSLAIQAHYDVERASNLHSPVSTFTLVIAESGERKSTCDGFFTKAIRDYESAQVEAAKPFVKDYNAAIESWEAKRSGIKDKIRQLAKAKKPTAGLEADLRDLGHNKPEPPRITRLIYGDVTPEELAFKLAMVWPSGGVVSTEAGVVFGSHGMGSDSVTRNLARLNVLWDGGDLPIDRRTTESFTVRGARLTMGLQVQSATLHSFFEKSGALARGTGFLARFLIACPESTQGQRPFTEAPENWPSLVAFNLRITEMLNQPVPINEDGSLTPLMLTLTPEAKAAWIAYHDAIEGELASGGELFDVRDVASKSADNSARLAALFHVFEGGLGAISADAFERASRIAIWHLSESRRFFGALALPAEMADAVRLDKWLLEHCRRERTHCVRKRYTRQHGTVRDGARLDAAISELISLDRIQLRKDGKQLSIWINPALMSEGVTL